MTDILPLLVSTIIPVYNRPEMVQKAVLSVIAQSYRPIEILIVDDGSTDRTPEVLSQLARDHPDIVHVFRQKNAGAGPARELGRLNARGAFIQYLDSDDYLLPNKFADQVAALQSHPDCSIAYGTSRHVDADGKDLESPSRRTAETLTSLFPLLLVERWWHTHTPLFCRWISDAAGPWPSFRPEDWDLEARMGALCPILIHCGSEVSIQVDHVSANRVTCGPSELSIRDQAIFLPRLAAAAVLAGVPPDAPQWRRFSDECFVAARLLHELGDQNSGDRLLRLAAFCCADHSPLISPYRQLSRLFGASLGSRLAQLARTGRWPR